MVRRGFVLVGALAALFVLGEAIARVAGVTEFPLHLNSRELGYLPAPNQQGAFLNRNDWAFNDRSMGVAEPFRPTARPDVLLIGDSVVYGGNPLRQSDKLGPQLEAATGYDVWPISAGSWGLANGLAYLKANPDVLAAADVLVFVLNSGDFYGASVWGSELSHPTRKPPSSLLYATKRYLAPRFGLRFVEERPQRPVDSADDWATLTRGKRVIVVRYPDTARLPFDWPDLPGAEIVDIAAEPGWKAEHYRDAVHPNAEGDRVLARIIADRLDRARR